MKLLVDVAKLQASGVVTAEQASEIRRAAATETASLAINVLSIFGIVAIVAGVFALDGDPVVGGVLGFGLAVAGILLRRNRADSFGLLANALIIIGLLVHCGAVISEWSGAAGTFAYATVVFLGLAILLRHGFLMALSVFSLAALLGSSTGYAHAAYALWIREATVTIIVFGLLAAAAYAIARRVGAGYAGLAQIFALLSIVWVNFGFWVGSLWGDYPGASWLKTRLLYAGSSTVEEYRALKAWYAQALFIPDMAFVIVWATGLVALGIWAAMTNRRAVFNAVSVFAAIHFYTQWFTRLDQTPGLVIAAGAIAVGIAFLLWRYNLTGTRPAGA